jgi:hypothetical protein
MPDHLVTLDPASHGLAQARARLEAARKALQPPLDARVDEEAVEG